MHIDVHLQNGDVGIYWLWLLLDISAVSVVIAICDMPRQEFSLRERVYILGIWKAESRVLKHANFEYSFQDDVFLIPVQLGDWLNDSKKTGCVKNRNVNPRRHVLKEETLDDIGERLEHAPPQKSLKRLS